MVIPAGMINTNDVHKFELEIFSPEGLFEPIEHKFDGIFEKECRIFARDSQQTVEVIEIDASIGEKD